MATNIVLKRSSSSGAVPGTSDLALGEIAINTYDGKIYTKKTVSGTSSIVEFFTQPTPTASAFDYIAYKYVATSNQTSFSGNDANSLSLSYTAGSIMVFLNGVLLDPTDYTATNGSAVVLDTGAANGDILYITRFAGVNPFNEFKYTASNAQTSFSGNDANSNSLVYTAGNIAVYLNGVLLDPTDYTATNGTAVVLDSGAAANDILIIHQFNQTGLTEVHADTTPQLAGDLDVNGNDIVSTSNANIDIIPHGTGDVNLGTDTIKVGGSGENVTLTTNGTGDLTLSTNSGTNSGTIVIADGANNDITLTPNGTGDIIIDGLKYPQADGSTGQFLKTDGSGQLAFATVDTATALDDVATGDAAATLATSAGNITIDAQGSDTDIIFKGTDGSSDITMLTLDGSAAGAATFNDKIIATELDISGNIDVDGTTNLDVVDIDGAVDMASTLGVTGVVTANAGVVVDEMTLDADTLTATDDFIIDAAADITLDAAGQQIIFASAGTNVGQIDMAGTDFEIKSLVNNADLFIRGTDGGSEITALTFDMSDAGKATFNAGVVVNNASTITVTEGNHVNGLKLINSQAGGYGSALTFESERSDDNSIVSAAQIRTQGQDSWNSAASADSNLLFATSLNGSLTDKMIIKHDGFVGVGTTVPENVIHTKGTNNSAGDLGTEVGPGNIPGVVVQNAGTTDNNLAALFFMDDASVRAGIHARFTSHGSDNTQLRLSTSSGGNLRERMVISETGNVAISDRGPPLAHYTGYVALDIGDVMSIFSNNTGTNISTITNNGFLNSNASNWIYKFTDEATMYSQVHGDHRFSTAASGSADAAITWSEKVRVQNAGGISFNGDTAAANALDDYEEGTFTPTFSNSNSTAVGKYTKIGKQVTVTFHVVSTGGLPSSGGQVQIGNLPFTSANDGLHGAGAIYIGPSNVSSATGGGGTITTIMEGNATVLRLVNVDTGTLGYTLWGELEVSSNNVVTATGTFTYFV